MIGYRLKIGDNWFPIEVIQVTKKNIQVKVPTWEKVYGDSRIWNVKRKDLKFYAD
jgi:hypothetical protein